MSWLMNLGINFSGYWCGPYTLFPRVITTGRLNDLSPSPPLAASSSLSSPTEQDTEFGNYEHDLYAWICLRSVEYPQKVHTTICEFSFPSSSLSRSNGLNVLRRCSCLGHASGKDCWKISIETPHSSYLTTLFSDKNKSQESSQKKISRIWRLVMNTGYHCEYIVLVLM